MLAKRSIIWSVLRVQVGLPLAVKDNAICALLGPEIPVLHPLSPAAEVVLTIAVPEAFCVVDAELPTELDTVADDLRVLLCVVDSAAFEPGEVAEPFVDVVEDD